MSPHTEWPLRKIIRREVQNGTVVIVLACKHATLARPLTRWSRFMPCYHCHQIVEHHRKTHERRTENAYRK